MNTPVKVAQMIPAEDQQGIRVDMDVMYLDDRDIYDFNAGWFEDTFMGLGVWSKQRCLSKAEMLAYKTTPLPLLESAFPGFVPARNTDFRRWQNQRNEGGDFFVFSDVLWEPYRGPAIELP